MRRFLAALAIALLWTSAVSAGLADSPTPTGTPSPLPTLTRFPTRTPTDTRTPTTARQPIVSFDRGGSCSTGDGDSSAPWAFFLLPLALWAARRSAPARS
jgi:MYXO-CTERM domain-containing protein